MNIDGTYRFTQPPERVWAVLLDLDAVAACLPGCRGFEATGENAYRAELAIGVGPVSGKFTAGIALEDQQPPRSYRLRMDASGGPGFVRGEATITLEEEEGGTAVHVAATDDVDGTVARVGQRLLAAVARSTMDRFFGCLGSRIQ
jgi:2-furoyl-CoA dehydrogenase large subunit